MIIQQVVESSLHTPKPHHLAACMKFNRYNGDCKFGNIGAASSIYAVGVEETTQYPGAIEGELTIIPTNAQPIVLNQFIENSQLFSTNNS